MKTPKSTPKIELVATATLIPYARNAKKHDAAQVVAQAVIAQWLGK